MKKNFTDRLGKERLFCDGGTGSLLQARGLQAGELPERWNLTHPDDVRDVAFSYYQAGSDIVNSNTFGANALKYPEDLRQIVEAGVRLVREARTKAGREDAFVALDMGPTGKLLKPLGDLAFESALQLFGETARIGTEAGADLILIETLGDTYEAKAAVLGAKENSDLPVCVTMTYDQTGKLLTGGTVAATTALLEGLGVDALGINCGLGPSQMIPLIEELTQICSIPIILNPNAGLPRSENGRTVYDVGPEEFASLMRQIASMGVHVMGGCCGTTPDHIRALIRSVRDLPFTEPVPKNRTFVSSGAQAVEIGPAPVIIGERINPTGKKRFQQALREKNLDYITEQAIEQEESGAQILDVNVGLPDIDEPAMMQSVITSLQSVTFLPLQIDTSDPEALERGLRCYNGKPMINSVNGNEDSLQTVMPLVKKYGGVLVGLCLDESGIPATSEGRIAIADRIYEAARAYGIPRKDIVIDALALTVSSDSTSACTTLDTLRRIRDEEKGHSILGVSNISFGLPRREVINSTFFTMAMQNGLSCAIINPNNEDMMRSYYAFLALYGLDPQCMQYIEKSALWRMPGGPADASGSLQRKTPKAGQSIHGPITLAESIVKGLSGQAAGAAREALEGPFAGKGLELVNEQIIPALDQVGKGFEAGTIFLPQLLMSAEAAQSAFEVIKEKMDGRKAAERGTIILATVKNDIHDIGKNIVRVMLENYSYRVIDLGKDVPPELILETAKREKVKLVGLSALMTTTVSSMEETVRLLHKEIPGIKVMVGGAVLTQEYANMIGADFYAKDAMESVRCADRVFGY